MGGFHGSEKFPGLSAYSTSKGALATLTECLALELADRNIRVNCLCLGAVQTEMLNEEFPGLKAAVQPGEMGEYIASLALHGNKFYIGMVMPVALNYTSLQHEKVHDNSYNSLHFCSNRKDSGSIKWPADRRKHC